MELSDIFRLGLDIIVVGLVLGGIRYHFARFKELNNNLENLERKITAQEVSAAKNYLARQEIEHMIEDAQEDTSNRLLAELNRIEQKLDLILKYDIKFKD